MPNDQETTIAEAMAIAILRREWDTVWPLYDLLTELRDRDRVEQIKAMADVQKTTHPVESYAVYLWPEFIAFADRLGFLYDASTVSVVITLNQGEMAMIEHKYLGHDTATPMTSTQPPAETEDGDDRE